MSKAVVEYVTEDGSRRARMHNIAVTILHFMAEYPSKRGVTAERVRSHTRSMLKMSELSGEEHLGDLRANGDALGGHGLNLECIREREKRVVLLNEATKKKCEKFLSDESDDILR